MTGFIRLIILAAFTIIVSPIIAQDTLPIKWKVSSRKINANEFELSFSSLGNPQWHLYAPNQLLFDVPTTTLELPDSTFQLIGNFIDSGNVQSVPSTLFEGQKVKIYQ